ncbi:uncharacterized protein F4812DRAFT_467024 [Daldinia caldariorum]|uniref:uncharacterized protein n=1 Tax=Daldinia caldariorum TaxID=326644 RepID=UPI0020087AFB|nr:uncharacterized protein F4812DRAFT_467024 [Daldinia caldariorum]KAI1464780.1 hypothetical protein F4812DRAFT_467024 [Daldinia caldariorum]
MARSSHIFAFNTPNLTKNIRRPAQSGQHYRPNYPGGFALERSRYDITTGPNTRLYNPSALDDLTSPWNFGPSPPAITSMPTTPQYIPIASRASSASTFSQNSYPATEAEKRQSARELFEQHGIRRPPGWFSDDEDLSLLGDRTAGPRRFCRICHVCSTRTWSQTHCLSCRHRLCEKCLCEVPTSTEKEHKAFSHNHSHVTTKQDNAQYTRQTLLTPEAGRLSRKKSRSSNRTSNNRSAQSTALYQSSHTHAQGNDAAELQPGTWKRVDNKTAQLATLATDNHASRRLDSPPESSSIRSIKQNPFVVDDKEKAEPTTGCRVPESSGVRHYHCQISDMKIECDDPMCRATHAGYYPYRHSITCALHRSEEAERSAGSARRLLVSNKAAIAHPTNPQPRKDTLQRLDDIAHRRHLTGPQTSYHISEHIAGDTSHGTRHLHSNRAGQLVNEAGYGARDKCQEFRSTETEYASHTDRGHDIAGEYAAENREAPRRTDTSNTARAKQTKCDIKSRTSLPKSRVFSPPSWLQAPSKEAGDARSRLRHIDTGNYVRPLDVNIMNSGGGRGTHSRSPVREKAPENAENRQPSSHRRRRPAHLQVEDTNRYSRSTYRSPPPARSDLSRSQQSLESSRRPSSVAHEQPRIGSARPENDHLSVYPQNDTRTVRTGSRSPLSATTTRASHSPLQPRRILRSGSGGGGSGGGNADDGRAAFVSRSAAAAAAAAGSGLEDGRWVSSVAVTGATATATATSEFERLLHRPNPIAPPNHDCSWKERYLALTAEIRLLKAELSTRASLRGPDVGYTGGAGDGGVRGEAEDGDEGGDGDDLGIEGVTIVVHLKGRDDLVINTDLTQAAE